MQNVPKIVTERLRAATVSAEHPDADVLTAFSERLLPERERKSVLEHLARCGECREIVALALPVSEPAAQPVRHLSRGWLTWPVLRWGFVAAGIVAITSVGILQYRRQAERESIAAYDAARSDTSQPEGVAKEAKNQAPPAAGEPPREEAKIQIPTASAGPVPAPGESTPSTPNKQEREFDRLEALSKLQSPGTGGAGTGHAPATFGPSVRQQTQQNTFYANNSQQLQAPPAAPAKQPAPVPAAPPAYAKQQSSNQAVGTAQAAPLTAGTTIGGPIRDEKKVQNLDTLATQNQPAPALQLSGRNAGAEVARAKPAEGTANSKASDGQLADSYSVSATSSGNFVPSGALAPESAGWSINATGGLQRSVDQGKTWQDVDVNNGSGAYGANLSMALKSKSAREKALAKDKADAKETPAIVFRAVSANGPDVWAGGSGGALYHSTDAGGHWVRVVPSWSEVVLTDDIVSLQFADPQRGRILTSSSEIWTTADAGQTWQKH